MLELGQTISHYRITEKLGQGGMGVVHRAEDTTLGRQVAIKILPESFAEDPERLARFEREAKLLASLNHQNIAAIHGLEEADGERFIVMELAEGETLAKRISRGPLQVDEALEVCRQIAEGLEAAHEKGIIHRDLKPSNVMVAPDGKVKILDFGLARVMAGESAVAVAALLMLQPRPAPQLVRLNLEARITDLFSASPPFAISPDGSRVVYVSESQNEQMLFYRRLDQYEATPLPGTEDARNPLFSPDGQTVCFFSRGRLRRVAVMGGTPSVICENPTDYGWGTWGPDDTVVFATWSTTTGLFRVPAAGSKPETLTAPQVDRGESGHIAPHFLSGGEHILSTVRGFASIRAAALTLKTGKWKILDIPGNARYAATGHLVYYDQGSLFARRFDLAGMTLIGPSVAVVEDVYRPSDPYAGTYFDVCDTGSLLYLPAGTSRHNLELVWINKTGEVTTKLSKPVPMAGTRESTTSCHGSITSFPRCASPTANSRIELGGSGRPAAQKPS